MKRVFAHIGFSFALTLVVLNLISIKWVLAVLSVAGTLFVLSLLINKTRKAIAVPLCLFCSVLACLTFVSNYYGPYSNQISLDGKTANVEFYIVDVEEFNGYNYVYKAKTKSVEINGAPQKINLYVYSDKRIESDYYETINGKLKLNKIADNAFDSYGSFADGVFLESKLVNYKSTGKGVNSPNKYILDLRISIKEIFKKNLSKDNDGLALALVTGDKSLMNNELSENFKKCGASHLIAVSGLHLSVVAGGIYLLLKKLRVKKIPTVVISFAAIILYASLAGFSKSIVRAGIMMSVLLAGKLFNRKSDLLNSLGFAVFIMCLNPYAVTDIGALLTVSAMLGVVAINNIIIMKFLPKNAVLKYLYKGLVLSFSIFTATFPVMYFTFGNVSLIGVLLNIILIPIAEAALVSSVFVLALQFLPPLMLVAVKVSNAAAGALIAITKHFASLPFSAFKIDSSEMGIVIGAVFIIFGIAFIIKKNNRIFRTSAILSVIIAAVVLASSSIINYNNVFVREINGFKSTAAIIYDRERAVIIGVAEKHQYQQIKSIIETQSLDVSMIIDTNSSSYSKELTEEADVKNYVALPDDENVDLISCENILIISEFDVDLWEHLNIKYSYNQENDEFKIRVRVYGTDFAFDNKISKNENDMIYIVNNKGYRSWRVNKWLR